MCVAASAMVNCYLRLFLPHPESIPVGIDQQFENAVPRALDLVRSRPAGRPGSAVFLFPPNSAESPRRQSGARSHSQFGFYQRQG